MGPYIYIDSMSSMGPCRLLLVYGCFCTWVGSKIWSLLCYIMCHKCRCLTHGNPPTGFDGNHMKADLFVNELTHFFQVNAAVPGVMLRLCMVL
jgi:hypothetical protein